MATQSGPAENGVRRRILEAALEIAMERGYEGTTLALVTQRARVSVSSVYHQFSDKDELLAAALDHSYEDWRPTGMDWLATVSPDSLDERIDAMIDRMIENMVEEPAFRRLGLMLALEQRPVEAAARARFRAIRAAFQAVLGDWLAAAIPPAALEADPELPGQLARMVLAIADGYLAAVQADDELDRSRLIAALRIAVPAAVRRACAEGPAAAGTALTGP